MKTISRFATIGLAAAVTVCTLGQSAPPAPAAPAASGARKIVLHRPFAKGDTYKITVELKIRSEGSMGIDGMGSQGDVQEGSGSLSGTVRVMDVNAIGEPTLFMVHLDKAESKTGDKPDEITLAGADLGVSFPSGKQRFVRRDSKPLNKDEEMLLSMIFNPPLGVKPDEILGPGKEVKPGDSWPMNSEALAKAIAGAGEGKKPMDHSLLKGTVQFEAVETWEGVPCFRLSSKMTIKPPDNPRFVGEASMELREELLIPEDASSRKSKQVSEQLSDMRGKYISEDGKKLDVKNKSRMTMTTVIQ